MYSMIDWNIVRKIKEFIGQSNPKDYYVGITNSLNARLTAHNVSALKVVHYKATTAQDAKDTERHLIDKVKTSGGSGGGVSDSTFVYCYKKTSLTVEKT